MIVDVFTVTRISGTSTIHDLMLCIDPDAPREWEYTTFEGQPAYIICIDIRKPYARPCARHGFRHTHVFYLEMHDDLYKSTSSLSMPGVTWLRAYQITLLREVGIRVTLR